MKWQWILMLLTLEATQVLSQEPAAVSSPATATINEMEAPASPPVEVYGPANIRRSRLSGNHNFPNFINWVGNPLQNIDPRAVTAIYPLFGSNWVSNTPPVPDTDVQLYGPGMTVALSERFAVGLNQGGYAVAHFSRNPVVRDRLFQRDPLGRFRDIETDIERDGWLNLGGFFQYTLIENVEDQFILTGGLHWVAPCGSHEMFQGHGPLELAPYVTVGKEFGKFHLLATTGYQFPAGPGNDYLELFYANVHLDRQVFGWLYPLVEINTSYHAKGISLERMTRRGFVDFGNFESEGNVATVSSGANVVLVAERLELGAVYTTVIASQHNFDAKGLLVKMVVRY